MARQVRKKVSKKVNKKPDPAAKRTLRLPETLRISDAADVYAYMLDVSRESGPVCIESAALRQIDTAGLQLLAAFASEIRKQGAQLVWPEPAPVLCNAANVLGMGRMLDLPS